MTNAPARAAAPPPAPTASAPVDLFAPGGLAFAPGQEAVFTYRNYEGKVGVRRVRVIGLWIGATPWHPRRQPLLRAFDLDKGAERDFAVNDIQFDAD